MSDINHTHAAVYMERRRKRQKKIFLRRLTRLILVILLISTALLVISAVFKSCEQKNNQQRAKEQLELLQKIKVPEWVDVQLINIHGSARSGKLLSGVNNIVIHYVGNPGSSAEGNRNYFNKPDTDVSAHFVVGLEGEVIQCVPLNEKSAASNWRNSDTISIEVCHPDESGKFNDVTYESLVKLTSWLCGELGLDETDVIRHYDITGKICPKYFVDHEDAWEKFRDDVRTEIKELD